MIEYIFTIVIILLTTFIYSCIIKPKKLYNYYVKQVEKLGYKPYTIPFQALSIPFIKIL